MDTITIIIAFVSMMVVLFVFYLFLSFKHTLVIRRRTGGKSIVKKYKFKEYVDRQGVTCYKLLSKKEYPTAPPDCISVTDKGKMWVEAWEVESGELQWIKESEHDKTGFVPFNMNQRQAYVMQLKKAEDHKRKSLSDVVVQSVAIGSAVLLVVALMVFWGDLAQPLLDMKDKQISHDELLRENLQLMKDIKEDVQRIETQQRGGVGGE